MKIRHRYVVQSVVQVDGGVRAVLRCGRRHRGSTQVCEAMAWIEVVKGRPVREGTGAYTLNLVGEQHIEAVAEQRCPDHGAILLPSVRQPGTVYCPARSDGVYCAYTQPAGDSVGSFDSSSGEAGTENNAGRRSGYLESYRARHGRLPWDTG